MLDEGERCPISLETIEIYIQILKPFNIMTVCFQYATSSIADVIPGIHLLKSLLSRMRLVGEPHEFRLFLIHFLGEKFMEELKSEANLVFKKRISHL